MRYLIVMVTPLLLAAKAERIDPFVNALARIDLSRFRHLFSTGKALSVSAINQAVSSVTNLALGVYLARTLSPEEFGSYGISFSIVLLYSGLGNALILTQMAVNFPERATERQNAFAANMLWLVVVLCAVTVVFAFCAWGVLSLFPAGSIAVSQLMATAAAAISYLLKDYFVRLAYSRRRERSAVLVNCAVALGTLVSFVVMWVCKIELSTVSSLCAFTGGQLLGAAVGLLNARLPLANCVRTEVSHELRMVFRDGQWAAAGALVIWLQSQAYVYITAMTVGPAGVGYANAARLFVSPFQSVLPAVGQVMLPRLSAMRVVDPVKVVRTANSYVLFMSSLAAIYLLVLAMAFPLAARIALGHKYSDIGWFVILWGFALMAQVIRDSASTTMQSLRAFRAILIRNLGTAVAAIGMTYWLSAQFGVSGAILAIAAAELMLAALLWQYLVASKQSELSMASN